MEQMDGYDFKADIWSLGITALELAKGHAPYSSFAPMKVLLYTIQNEPPSLASYPDGKRDSIPFSRSFRDLVRMCLQKDPSKRPTCAKLLTHALFTQKEPNPNSLVNDLLSKMRDFGDVSTVPLASQLTKQTSPVDAANAHTARAGSDGSGGGVVQGAAGLEAVMNQALQEEEAQPYYPKWSFGDAEIREALSQIGVNLAPPMPPSHPQTVLEETAESNQIEQEVEHTNENVSDQQNSSQNDNLDIVNNNTMEVDQEVDHGGHGGEESNQSIESEDEQFQHHAGVRADQDAYVSAMGGALELLSEEEVNEDKTAEAAIASDQNDVVFAFINAIGNEFGGEFKSAESLDDSPHSVPSEIPNNGDGADNGDGIQPGRTEDEERRNEGEGGDEEAMR
jgi:serine/threonine protein kinase